MDEKKTSDKKKKKFPISKCIFGVIIFCIVLFLVIFFCSGKTTTVGENTGTVQTDHISCTSSTVSYPFFSYDNSDKKELKIDATFKDDGLYSMSLMYKLYYSDSNKINLSESSNHAAMNTSFGNRGFNSDALNASYSKLNDNLQFSIYASGDELTNSALVYFMLEPTDREKYNNESTTKYYSNMGMDCKNNK